MRNNAAHAEAVITMLARRKRLLRRFVLMTILACGTLTVSPLSECYGQTTVYYASSPVYYSAAPVTYTYYSPVSAPHYTSFYTQPTTYYSTSYRASYYAPVTYYEYPAVSYAYYVGW